MDSLQTWNSKYSEFGVVVIETRDQDYISKQSFGFEIFPILFQMVSNEY